MNRFLTPHSTYTVNAIHPEDITNYRGFPKTWYVDAFLEREGYHPETSFQDPAKNLPGFGVQHRRFLRRYNQMTSILLLAMIHHGPITTSRRTGRGIRESTTRYSTPSDRRWRKASPAAPGHDSRRAGRAPAWALFRLCRRRLPLPDLREGGSL